MRAGECRIENSTVRLLCRAKSKVHSKVKVFIEKSIKKSNHQRWPLFSTYEVEKGSIDNSKIKT